MAYRAEIEIAIRGAKQLKDLQSEIERTSTAVNKINEALNSVNNQTAVTFNSLSRTLSDARQAFDNAARGTSSFGDAINTLIKTEREYNDELRERNSLLNQARAAQTAAAQTISPGLTGFSAEKFGPQVPTGTGRQGDPAFPSSPVAERLSQQLRDQAKLKASLLALDEKSAAAAQERLKLSTQLKEELNDIKVAARTGPREPEGFSKATGQRKVDDSVRRQQIMKEGAEFAAQQEANRKATIESYNKVAEFAKKNEATVFGIRAKNIRRTLDLELDRILKEAKAKNKALDENHRQWKQIDKNTLADFDKRLNAEVKAKEQAAKDVRKAEKKIEDQAFKERQARRAKLKDAVGSGLIGGAFPLLFGQGGGAAIGGGLGGFAGGLAGGQMGFALSLVGTQFGAFADQIVSGGATLGQALDPLTADIDALAEAAGFAGTETGKALKTIQQLGSEHQALEAATALLAATVGDEGVESLKNFGEDTAELGREFGRAMTLMQTAASRFFQSIPGFVAGVLKNANDLAAGLNLDTPEAKKLIARRNELFGVKPDQPAIGPGIGAGAFDSLNAKEKKEVLDIENKLRELARDVTTEAEAQVQAAAEALRLKKVSSALGIKDVKLNAINTELARLGTDYTNENFVKLKRAAIIRERDLAIERAIETVGRDQNGNIKDREQLRIKEKQIIDESITKQNQLARDVDEAFERQNKKLARGVEKTNRQNKQLLQQEQQAKAVTAQLERQLAQSKIAGSFEAQKLNIEAKYKQTMERISRLKNQDFAVDQAALADQIRKTELANLETAEAKRQADAIRNAVAPIKNIRESQEANLAASKEYNRLLMEGVLPSEAKRLVEFNKQVDAQIRQVEEAIRITELDILRAKANDATTKKLEEQLDLLKKQKTAIEGEASKGPGKNDTSDRKIIEDRVAELRGELTEMTKLGNVAVKVADNIGAAFSTAFQDVINGSKSTQQALSDMFRTIGENFIAMAADIIAHQIQMIILQTILKALGAVAGASAGGGGGGAASKAGSQINVSPGPDAFKGGSFFASPSDPLFAPPTLIAGQANGGPVEGGRPYMVGERGPEMFIPGSSGGIMRNEDMRQLMGRSPAGANAPQMNFTFETTNIGGTEFVSREQLEVAMATTRRQAASDGAKQGMSMTLDKMQNSPRTRSRVGIR